MKISKKIFAVVYLTVAIFSQQLFSQTTPQPDLLPGSNAVTYQDNTYKFYYGGSLLYEYSLLAGGSLNGLTERINSTTTFKPSFYGGPTVLFGTTEKKCWESGVNYILRYPYAPNIINNTATVNWSMQYGGAYYFDYTYKFTISGRTLIIEVEGDINNPSNVQATEFNLDRCEYATNPKRISVPYLTLFNLLNSNSVYTSMFFDWETTNSSELVPLNGTYSSTSEYFAQLASYKAKTNNTRNKLKEKIYLTFSTNIEEVLPNIPNPTSPKRSESASKMVWDYWQGFTELTDPSYNHLNNMYNAGIRNLWILIHPWQKYGYDNKYPDIAPLDPNGVYGTDAQLTSTISAIKSKGYLAALHENYFDISSASDTYLTTGGTEIARLSDNTQRTTSVLNNVQNYLLKPSRAAFYLQRNFNNWILNYGANSSFLDVHSAVNPNQIVDYDTNVYNAGMFREALNQYRSLYSTLRSEFNGPVSGEGRHHMLHVGYIDDIEAQINTVYSNYFGYYAPLLVNFDLLKLRPKTIVHGVGYYERFFGFSDGNSNFNPKTRNQVLTYIATELAYGHGSFIPTPYIYNNYTDAALLEQTHVLPIQQVIANATPTSIIYYRNGIEVGSASQYINNYTGWDDYNSINFMSQVKITYSNGVIICVNRNPEFSWTINLGKVSGWYSWHASIIGGVELFAGSATGGTFTLPFDNGWVVYVPNGLMKILEESNSFETIPNNFVLHNNYPNPFNPETTIRFELPEVSHIKVIVYDILGRKVTTLFDGVKEAGYHSIKWNGSNNFSNKLSSGVYVCHMEALGASGRLFNKQIKMILAK